MRTSAFCGVAGISLNGALDRACRIAIPRVIGVRIIMGRLSPHAVAGERGPMFSAATLHSLDDVLDAFTEHLRVTRGASPATCERSVRDVRQLLTLLSASGQRTEGCDASSLAASRQRACIRTPWSGDPVLNKRY